ncbi:MAG: tetraacyldisaccharide 4'-kinase [Synergistaceae bacterium]|nr:tetraacyldisaccharide 4'-kinase [Synergistaceae bacterium]
MSCIIQSYLNHVRGGHESLSAKILWSALIPVSWISYICINILNFLFNHGLKRTQEPVLPVISVGNLTYGGTNKTPFVDMLARFMISKNIKPGVVSRGYSNKNNNKNLIFYNGEASRAEAGDEPLLLSKRLPSVPIAVSKKRINGISALKEHGAEIVIADDAFQHRSLMRDADILLIDASCPFGSGRMMPAGILREPVKAISRAHLIVITKCEQVDAKRLLEIKEYIAKFAGHAKIFTSRLKIHEWTVWQDGGLKSFNKDLNNLSVIAFSAIGNPDSFIYSLKSSGLDVKCEMRFKDHRVYNQRDLNNLLKLAEEYNADALACTEKDLYNLNNFNNLNNLPLIIPRVEAVLDEPDRFFNALIDLLKPKIIVASNGYGEDAIGVLLASKLRERFKNSEILAFPLVGKGDAYLNAKFKVCSAPSVTPSGGVVKYRLKDLLGDMRAGLLKHVKAQLDDWEKLAGRVRTPICVGDVYLLLHTLWGSGVRPLFAATAKTVYLNGHWRLERALIKRFALRTWTRDLESAAQLNLNNKYQNAVYSGSPIMDLLLADAVGTSDLFNSPELPDISDEILIMLLPGSRNRAYQDLKLLLDAALILNNDKKFKFRFKLVLAPTLELDKFKAACETYGWEFNDNFINFKDLNLRIDITSEPVASAARGVRLLIGFGGTANQVCAGLGIPVVSIDEKGKRVQKKLLGDAEILVDSKAESLADCALKILNNKELYKFMSEAGVKRMGSPGAIDAIINYAAEHNGWDARDRLYNKLMKNLI